MPLRLPNLDDRPYNDLVAEALSTIPAYAPEWTNHNPSDPGITLIELFAYLTDILLYRLNRVTDANRRKFLKLLTGQEPAPNADLREAIRTAVLEIREPYRAVTKEDYEFLSTNGFHFVLEEPIPKVSRAHCVPQRNLEAGTEAGRLKPRPGHVSVVIVPKPNPNPNPPPQDVMAPHGASTPQPSAAEINALLTYLNERRLLTTRLHVTGPFYAHVSAQLVIARNSDAVDNILTDDINDRLTDFLNPLPSGGREGWPFGRDVFVSDIYETLEKIRGINFITDVMLESRPCTHSDANCVEAEQIWHAEGDLIGLRIQDHHLPVFDRAAIVIVPNNAFVTVNLSVTAQTAANADQASLKRIIRSAMRDIFHPRLNGRLGPNTTVSTRISKADVLAPFRNLAGVQQASVAVTAVCIPSNALRADGEQDWSIEVPARHAVDWRVAIHLS
jgi:hypothetical protein